MQHRTRIFLPGLTFALATLLATPAAWAQTQPHWLHPGIGKSSIAARDSGAMLRLVRPLSESVRDSVVQVFSGPRVVGLGTVVSEDGYLITKWSELGGDVIKVRLPGGDKVDARVSAVRRRNDLALLKIVGGKESEWEIEPIEFKMEAPSNGSFLVSAGRDGYTVGIGILGVQARAVGHDGRLGVRFFDTPTGPATVRDVVVQSGAFEAGLRERDQILKINGKEMFGSQAAINLLRGMYPGEVVHLTVKRGDGTHELNAMMSDETMLRESKNDAKVNGPRNARLRGFDRVIQHDTVLSPNQCGGPTMDSRGNVIGINIARAGRVVSYALPASLVAAEVISMLDEARN